MKTRISAIVIVALLLGLMSAAFANAPKAKVKAPAKPAGVQVVKAKPATPAPEASAKTAVTPSRTKAAPVKAKAKAKGHVKKSTKGYRAVTIKKATAKKPAVAKKAEPKVEPKGK